ncbi:MAG TPA: helix-turn-helix domain-containing protein [Methanosarcina sp.]|jgi:predicted transcriptional regulator|nr:helix-turn-helix domain-containing protein [Methanosarcina sp.]
MKLKDIEIKVMSDEAYGDHLDELFKDTRDGKITKKQKTQIVARTPEDIAKILTSERIRLLQMIREKKPESISKLAHLLDRSQSNVSNDIKYLEGIGLLELEVKNDPIMHKKPLVNYDAVRITVDLSN